MVVYYALVVIWAICAVALLPKKIIYVVPLRSSIQKRPIDSHNFQVALMSFFLFLVMALRSNDVGVDTHQYAYHYEFILSIKFFK